MKVTINLIAGDRKLHDFMRAADVFETCKNYGQTLAITYDLQQEPDLAFLERLRDKFEASGSIVTALWFQHAPDIHWVDWNCKAFSDGMKWAPLAAYLKAFGIEQPVELQTA